MKASQRFESVCRAMADPAFYPHPVSRLERRDTHISSVFLTGKWVYKLKKPVDFGFLDFRSPEDRRRFCEAEVSLNRRLSRGVYEGVVEIFENEAGQFSFEKSGRVAEYAVKMKQLPEEASLEKLLKAGEIRASHMGELGRTLASFYGRSDRNPQIDHYGRHDVIAFNMEENFRQLAPFSGDVLDSEKWEFLCQVNRAFWESHRDLFERRIEQGRIRDGHGDLRTDHIYFCDGIQIIDCIEFNDRFRYGDVAVDLAFLHMDMEHRGYSELSRIFLASYVNHSDDPELYSLIDFYAAYRAVVRLKISCLRLGSEETEAEQQALRSEAKLYMDQAYRYAFQFSRPTLWVFCGLPATGKSYLAGKLAETMSIPLFQSDRIRKDMRSQTQEEVVPFGEGTYRTERRHRVYAQMLASAQETLRGGRSAILDATFSHRRWRDEARQLATDLDTNLLVVECVCKEETIRDRLKQREKTSGLSDARLQHLPQMTEDFEPLVEIAPEARLMVNTDQPLRQSFLEVLDKGYAGKCAQVRKLL